MGLPARTGQHGDADDWCSIKDWQRCFLSLFSSPRGWLCAFLISGEYTVVTSTIDMCVIGPRTCGFVENLSQTASMQLLGTMATLGYCAFYYGGGNSTRCNFPIMVSIALCLRLNQNKLSLPLLPRLPHLHLDYCSCWFCCCSSQHQPPCPSVGQAVVSRCSHGTVIPWGKQWYPRGLLRRD